MKGYIFIILIFIPGIIFSQVHFDSIMVDSTNLPMVFDLRNTDILSPVKTQPTGGCWTSASNNVLESVLRKSSIGDFTFSDLNMQLYNGFSIGRKTYGNHYMSTAYYTRGSGPVIKSSEFDSIKFIRAPSPVLITDARFLPENQNLIKQTIQDWGPIYSMMYFRRQEIDTINHIYYTEKEKINHVVSLVGWNDTLQTKIGRGAWVAQNSLGTKFGEEGFFYIPYQDNNITKYNAIWTNWISNYSNLDIYYYDTLGAYNSYGFNDSICAGMIEFEAKNDGVLKKVGTWITAEQTKVKIEVYKNFNKETNKLSLLISSEDFKVCKFPGYYTFDLQNPVSLKKSETFYIAVTYITSFDKPLPIERYVTDYCDPHITTGKCWINPNPTEWPTSWYEVGLNSEYDFLSFDLCIRAYILNNLRNGSL